MSLSALVPFDHSTKQPSNYVACASFVPLAEQVWDGRRWRTWSEQQPIWFQGMRLETGNRQLRAMALSESYGFIRIPPFDDYVNDPTSVCYEKHICPG
jgi:hypothetical protein